MGGPKLLVLLYPDNIVSVESLFYLPGRKTNHDIYLRDSNLAAGIEHVGQHWSPAYLMQHLRHLRIHSAADARCQDYCYSFSHSFFQFLALNYQLSI
ncbi:hypothetical protein ES703_97006 [subsurface metagenome]